jgi:hypothetical protein
MNVMMNLQVLVPQLVSGVKFLILTHKTVPCTKFLGLVMITCLPNFLATSNWQCCLSVKCGMQFWVQI